MHFRLLMVLILGLVAACTDGESTGETAPVNATNVPGSESGVLANDDPASDDPVSSESEVSVTDESNLTVSVELDESVSDESVSNESDVAVSAEPDVPVSDEAAESVANEPVVGVPDSDCIDLVSANADWSDNCVISTSQPYSQSTYLLGVQRILWCVEAFSDPTLTMSQVTDGTYADRTEEAVRGYQSRHALSNTGSVDMSTWSQLQQELTLVGAAAAEYSSFAIAGARCDMQVHFYQRNTEPHDWKIAAQPDSIELLDFSGLDSEQ